MSQFCDHECIDVFFVMSSSIREMMEGEGNARDKSLQPLDLTEELLDGLDNLPMCELPPSGMPPLLVASASTTIVVIPVHYSCHISPTCYCSRVKSKCRP